MATPRLSIAFPIPKSVIARLQAFQDSWAVPGVLWTDPAQLQLGLLSLGSLPLNDWIAICRCVQKVALDTPPLELQFSGMGGFPNLRRPKSLHVVTVDRTGGLAKLHRTLTDRLFDAGLHQPENRGYVPHLSLGRVPASSNTEAIAVEAMKQEQYDFGKMIAAEVSIFSTEVKRGTLQRETIGHYPLDGEFECP